MERIEDELQVLVYKPYTFISYGKNGEIEGLISEIIRLIEKTQ